MTNAQWRLVASREITQRMRSKTFVVSSVLLIAFAVGGVVLSALAHGDGRQQVRIVLVDQRAALVDVPEVPAMQATLPVIGDALDRVVSTTVVADRATADALLRAGTADVVIDGVTAIWHKSVDNVEQALIQASAQTVVRDQRAASLGLTPDQVRSLVAPVAVTSQTLEPRDTDAGVRAGTAAAGLILLFLSVQIHGAAVLMGVVEEKSSRIVEVLLGHVRPRALLAGKIVGIGTVGLVQVTLVASAALVSTILVRSIEAPHVPATAIVWFVVWFVLGFALYATVFAGLGSLVSRQEDAQSVVTPATLPLLASYFVGFAAVANPESTLARVTSIVPFSAPMVMPVRIAAGSPPAWQIALALGLVVITIGFVLRLAAIVYEGNVLRTGSRATLATGWRTIRRTI
jgi:ABC-2 type transport system permease protein